MLIFPAVPEKTGMSRSMAAKNLVPHKIFAFLDLPVPGTKMEKSAPERRIPVKFFQRSRDGGKNNGIFKTPPWLPIAARTGGELSSPPVFLPPLGARARGVGGMGMVQKN